MRQPWDEAARHVLNHWAQHRLPLVVTRQPANAQGSLALGLPAPLCWNRRRIALSVPLQHIAATNEFPHAEAITELLPETSHAIWRRLCADLSALDATAHVYGSHGWQGLSGLAYLHAESDIDLWVAVNSTQHADAVTRLLAKAASLLPRRLDGELMFADGRAYAWREWQAWREPCEGSSRSILCKTLNGVSLVHAADAATSRGTPAVEPQMTLA